MQSRFEDAGPITARNIMTHHSGLPGDYWKGMWGNAQADFAQLPALIRNEYVAYPPNEIFAYSNLGLSLLGLAVQNISGESFSSYMDRHLLQPMGMEQSSFELTPAIQHLLSRGYDKGKARKSVSLRDLPAGGLYSTVEDMARFAQMVFSDGRSNGHQILGSGTLAEMLRTQNRDIPLDVGFHVGLGWILSGQDQYRNSGPVVWHTGGTFRFMSMFMLMPEHKLGVVVLTNSKEGMLLINKVATRALRMALEQKTGIRQPGEDSAPKKTITRLSPEAIESVPGYYATIAGPVLIKAHGERLHALLGRRKLNIESYEDGTFGAHFRLLGVFRIRGPLKNISFSFREIEGHQVLVLHGSGGSSMIMGEKITLPAIPEAWRKRLGSYEVMNPDEAMSIDQVRLEERHHALHVRLRPRGLSKKAITRTLLPLSDTEAIIAGLGRGHRETVRATVRDGATYLHYSGFEFRKIKAANQKQDVSG
jgi:hypothetical protein